MNKLLIYIKLLPAFAIAAVLGACGGGGGGSAANMVQPQLAKGSFNKVAAPGIGVGQWLSGVIGGTGVQRSQTLLLASDIKASGVVSSLNYVLYADFAGMTCDNVVIHLSHMPATMTFLSGKFADNLNLGSGAMVTVLSATNMTFPSGKTGTGYPISLDPVFTYNGVDNLLIDIVAGPCSVDGPQLTATDATADVRVVTQDTTNTNGVLPAGDARVTVLTLGFSGGVNQQAYGTGGVPTPFNTSLTPKEQFLFKAADINGSGPITGFAFQTFSAITTPTTLTYSIRMAHTSLTSLPTGGVWDDAITGNAALVADNVTLKLPAGTPAGSWFWVPLSGAAFDYNGTDNLLIEVDNTAADNSIYLEGLMGVTGNGAYNADNTAAGPTALTGFLPNIRLRFNGAPVQVFPVKTTDSSLDLTTVLYPQYVSTLLRPEEIGDKGSIVSMGCRVEANTYAGTFPTLSVRIDNSYGNSVTVYNGNIDLQNALTPGDWFEIPFNTPYSYNGTDTLKIYLKWSNATGGVIRCDAGEDATLYPIRTATGDASASPMTLTYLNVLPTMMLNIVR